ncbi:hypothetical protein SAMN02982989_3355 [Xaviernesmea oryzae]|uniref:Integrase n=1 Tax=Xaviernesmea oryzae TaxID=464029 RepID=A0A1X7G7V6_9HYPH|nr:hypothetical protein [Xaviernesmea oryzae]SMF65405.1 hypothetical protein SAMN02982989_3355 [Xaviernesmea oryzae]
MVPMTMPKYTSFKRKQGGSITFYWTCPTAYRKAGAPFTSVTLGHDLTQKELNEAAATWNERLDGWRKERSPMAEPDTTRHGTVEWLVNSYLRHDSFLERVGEFSRPDYRRIFDRVCDTQITRESTQQLFRVGDLRIANIGVSTAEKIYKTFADEGAGRTSEKIVTYCKAMWKRMKPHHPDLFRQDTPNPWEGVTVKRRAKKVKGHVDRESVYAFAEGAIRLKRPELAAAAVLAFEFFLRPSNIGAGYAPWTGYRGESAPDKIIFSHRKTGERAEHPLEYIGEDGAVVALYAQAEAIFKRVPKYGTSIVCQKNGKLFGDGTRLSQDVREIADKLTAEGVLSPGFTLDKARHGGMTELEEMGLTEGQGRVLSKHRTSAAYRGYAKETEKRVLEATKRRFGISENSENVSKINEPKTAEK